MKEVVYDRLEIFYKFKRIVLITDSRMYNRKHIKEMGKFFIKILKELTDG